MKTGIHILDGAANTAPIDNSPTPPLPPLRNPVTIGSSSVDDGDGDGSENVTVYLNSCFSKFVAFIPIR